MNQVVTQMTAHDIAHLELRPDGSLVGPAEGLDRLASLASKLRRWYGVAALLFIAAVGPAGVAFFVHHPTQADVRWLGPWLLLTVATAGNLYLGPSLAMLEGAGQVGEVARMRLVQSMIGYAVTWLALVGGAQLWASTTLVVVSALYSGWWLHRHGTMLHWLRARRVAPGAHVDWRRDIFPLQWRIAVSWVSGYFIFQLFTPLLFRNQGAVAAGRFGIVLAMFSAIQQIGMSWVYSKGPLMAAHIARGERAALNAVFRRAARPSVVFMVLACSAAVAGGTLMSWAGLPIARRLASPEVLLWIGLTTIVNTFVFAMAVYMRAHKEEPMMPASVALAAAVLPLAWFASRISLELTAQSYFWASLLISLPWFYREFRRYWRRA